jgi:bifunctional non-homologous end joining protein LigD
MEWGVGTAPFDDPDYRFEPWWPGTRVLLLVERGEVRPVVEHLADPLSAFPELRGVAGLLGEDGVIIDGTLLVLDADGRPDADLLRERLAYPEVRNGEAAFVASDLIWTGGVDVSRRPFAERLERLVALLHETDWCMVARGYVGEGLAVADALGSMGLDAMSARHLGSPYRRGPSAGAWLRLPVAALAAPDRRPTLALIQRLGL